MFHLLLIHFPLPFCLSAIECYNKKSSLDSSPSVLYFSAYRAEKKSSFIINYPAVMASAPCQLGRIWITLVRGYLPIPVGIPGNDLFNLSYWVGFHSLLGLNLEYTESRKLAKHTSHSSFLLTVDTMWLLLQSLLPWLYHCDSSYLPYNMSQNKFFCPLVAFIARVFSQYQEN